MNLNRKNNKERGFSLIELLIVIVMIMVLAGGIWKYRDTTMAANNIQAASKDLNAIVTAAQSMTAVSGTFAGLNNTVLYNSSALPAHMKGAVANTIASPWVDNGISVAPNASNNRILDVTFSSIPDAVCVQFLSATLGNYTSVSVNGSTVTDLSSATTACSAVTGGDTIVFRAAR